MSDRPYFLDSLTLSGFRAFLQPKTFGFNKKRSFAIFAANGCGKSSVIDALEFFLSKDGTLDRLGVKTIDNNAGPVALAHNRAKEKGIESYVAVSVKVEKAGQPEKRPASGKDRPLPSVATELNGRFAVCPIVRGHDLRAFVEDQTPGQRYEDVARWLELAPLAVVQKNLRALRSQVKASAANESSLKDVDARVAKATAQAITATDAVAILRHLNESVLAPLDSKLQCVALGKMDPGYVELANRCQAEENRVGLAGLRQIQAAAKALRVKTCQEESKDVTISGAISSFRSAAATQLLAVAKEGEERSKAADVTFQALWEAAEPLFSGTGNPPSICPICDTPIAVSSAGSSDAIRARLTTRLKELSGYAAAKKELNVANSILADSRRQLSTGLKVLIGLCDETKTITAQLIAYQNAVTAWSGDPVPDSAEAESAIDMLLGEIAGAIADIEFKQGEHTYFKAKAQADRLMDLYSEWESALRVQSELKKLSGALNQLAANISGKIRTEVQSRVDTLQGPMSNIYRQIQGPGAAVIRLELPSEDDTNQQRLNLVVDFADNRVGVAPGGYLSDSQVHTVALAFRLAAIGRFNATAPVIALDDIVTSYDADYRLKIAELISAMSKTCQFLITTHDERFFKYLIDQVEANSWQFMRITHLDPSFGPHFSDHKVTDEMIEEIWKRGELAANQMRQAEEEWLLGICRDFGTNVRIRTLERAYSYERSELASALEGCLKRLSLVPPLVPGVNNRFLTSLQKGEVENFGSHFQDVPYGVGSIGDEKARWEEFKTFRAQFVCSKCGKSRFKRPIGMAKPVCAHKDCETPFEFSTPSVIEG